MSWQLGAHPDDAAVPSASEPTLSAPEPARRVSRLVGRVVIRPRADTRQADLLALLPIVPVLLSMCGPAFSLGWSVVGIVQLSIPVAIVAAIVARRDRRILLQRGFVALPSSLLALLHPILYLALRARACAGHDESASTVVRWAIGVTAAGLLMVGIGVGFQFALAPLFTGV